jgi:CheY-like chemotaxis protein
MKATVIAVAADLVFGSRIRGTAEQLGVSVEFARSADALFEKAPGARLILLDLDARWVEPGTLIAALKEDPATAAVPVVAFVSHVRTDAIDAARTAGADRVVPRSVFVRELPALLRG